MATVSVNIVTPVPEPIVFDDAKINQGDHYDPTTGIYTVSLDGTYEFFAQIESYQDSNNDWYFIVRVDGESILFTRHDASGSSASNEAVSACSTVSVHLFAGQEVWVETDLAGMYGSSGEMFSWFSGQLISAD